MPSHVAHAQRQRDDQYNRKAFGDDGYENSDGYNELLNGNFLQIHAGAAVRHDEVERNEQNRDDQRNETEKSSKTLQFQLQGRFWRG